MKKMILVRYTKLQDFSLLLSRLIIGAIFLYAGIAKFGFWDAPQNSAIMNFLIKFLSIVEPIGAVALIAGIFTRWVASGLAIIMVGAIFSVIIIMNAKLFTSQTVGWDYNLLILAGCLLIAAFGAGKWSADRIFKEK